MNQRTLPSRPETHWIATGGDSEFWSNNLVQALGACPVLSARIDTSKRNPWKSLFSELDERVQFTGYVYLIYSEEDALLYVGRATIPSYRVPKHQRKDWWPEAKKITVVETRSDTPFAADQAMFYIEAAAIHYLNPKFNIAAPSARTKEVISNAQNQND